MSWIRAHWRAGRVVGGVLLLVAIIGPWAYEADGKPPVEWCRAPDFVLNGYCVGLTSGATIISFLAMLLWEACVGLVTGVDVIGASGPGAFYRGFLLLTLPVLLLLPLLTTLLLMRAKVSSRQRILHLVVLGLAAGASLVLVAFEPDLLSGRFWGLWLYCGLTIGLLMWEGIALATERRRVASAY